MIFRCFFYYIFTQLRFVRVGFLGYFCAYFLLSLYHSGFLLLSLLNSLPMRKLGSGWLDGNVEDGHSDRSTH